MQTSTTAQTMNLNQVTVPKPELTQELYKWGIWGVFLVSLLWSFFPAEMNRIPELWTGAENMRELAKDFSKPDFRYWHQYSELMLETVQMAIWGSFLSVVAAVPFGLLSADNIAPKWVTFPVRRLMDATRAINELVFALIFVSAVGLGPLAGVLALAVHTTGTLAKLYSEAVEAIDPRPVEGIRATGASHMQEIVFGVIPQVLPLWISYSLYRFEANVRSATVLGIVGAGGIGMSLSEALRSFDFSASAAILLIIIVTVSMLDIFSQYLRKVVIDGEEHKKLVLYFLGMVVIFVLTEMAVAKVIDINAILRGEA
ncbi:MAG: phosphonate ABC transporter, permease protein PhnE [Rickettsiales bacterium TMED211]|nr:MAG: phosphonate ABC transporter, permease protein PhnE [Rickettsiales bacterium TMED211]